MSKPIVCPITAKLCFHLWWELPQFPFEELNGKPITFRGTLADTCQEAFEVAYNLQVVIKEMIAQDIEVECHEMERMVRLRTLGNIRFIGDIFKRKFYFTMYAIIQ